MVFICYLIFEKGFIKCFDRGFFLVWFDDKHNWNFWWPLREHLDINASFGEGVGRAGCDPDVLVHIFEDDHDDREDFVAISEVSM